ncbi:MAG: selenocysteine-specific translation elongation factor, partial [Anaerolineae bacterium]|nr:selenocysteine-specific translation elongation factor [Anaerolineae bacterium]
MRVIGTAGHVDHGKSTLVTALTGINPDRLKEEREREMTIDLGFAWMSLPDGEPVSIIDVPGHEDFIKNMLAGVGGIDAALLVVAADEGVMPQTREHVDILDLLQVKSGVVALTKTDLIDDPEWLDLVREEIREYLAGTSLSQAPIVAVSARTQEGLGELLAALRQALDSAPPRPDRGRPRLPIDRVFTMTGFGTVVTGTLSDGVLEVGQDVEILPGGLSSRIRGLQTHREKVDVASPGSRVAANLVGVQVSDLRRGDVAANPGSYSAVRRFDARVQLLPHAPRPLPHNAIVDLFVGASETPARLRLLDAQLLEPGQLAWVQVETRSPVVVVAQDRFIIRQPSPSATLGGGFVVDVNASSRHRRFRPEVTARLETLAHGTPEEILLQSLQRLGPSQAQVLLQQAGLPRELAEQALENLKRSGEIQPVLADRPAGTLMTREQWALLSARLRSLLEAYHDQYPLRIGMPREELKSRLSLEARLYAEVLQRAVAEGVVAATEAAISIPGHQPRFTPEQERRIQAMLARFHRQPYSPPGVSEAEAELGSDVLAALIE